MTTVPPASAASSMTRWRASVCSRVLSRTTPKSVTTKRFASAEAGAAASDENHASIGVPSGQTPPAAEADSAARETAESVEKIRFMGFKYTAFYV